MEKITKGVISILILGGLFTFNKLNDDKIYIAHSIFRIHALPVSA